MPGSILELTNFNAGELSERLVARTDLARYPNAGKSFFNCSLFREGGWARRPGTIYLGRTKNDERCKLLEHVVSPDEAALIALTDRTAQFWQDNSAISLPTTSLTISNGDFSSNLDDWTDASESGATVATAATSIPIASSTGTVIGTMTGGGGLSRAFDDNTVHISSTCASLVSNTAWIGKTWSSGKTITGFRLWGSTNRGFKQDTDPVVFITLQGSNNAFATSFTTLATKSLTDYASAKVDMFDSIDKTTAYTSHRLLIETPGGSAGRNIHVAEVVFYEQAGGTAGAQMTAAANGNYARLHRSLTGLTPGQVYGIGFSVEGVVSSGITFRVGTTAGGTDILTPITARTGWHVFSFLAPAATVHIDFRTTSAVKQTLANVRYVSGQLELTTPWPDATLDKIQWVQSGRIVFTVADGVAPYEIRRYAKRSWSIEQTRYIDGPWREEPDGEATITPSGIAERTAITLTASEAMFNPGHVGALFRLATKTGKLNFEPWAASKTGISDGDQVVNADIVYEKTAGSTTAGNIPPTHESGAAYDGKNGGNVEWTYRHRGYGVVLVTGYTSSTVVSALVLSRLPTGLDSGGTSYWRESAFSDYRGQPTCIGFYENRMVLADQADDPGTFFLSKVNSYLNYQIGEEDDDPIKATVRRPKRNRGDVHRILSISANDQLVLMTAGGPVIVRSGREDQPLTPANLQVKASVSGPASAIAAVPAQTNILYIGANKTQLYEMSYAIESDGYIANDLTVVADHIPSANGFEQLVVQELPWPVVWCRRADGRLASLLYDVSQGIAGWARHRIAGSYGSDNPYVEGMAVLPGNVTTTTVDRDVVYLTVARTINGTTVRTIEYLGSYLREVNRRARHVSVDAAVVYSFDAPTATLTGLDHLEGESVRIYADGIIHANRTVIGGTVTLDRNVFRAVVGLRYTHEYESLKFFVGAAKGTAQGQRKRISRLVLVVKDSVGGEYGDGTAMHPIKYPSPHTDDFLEGGLFSGEIPLDFPGDWERDPRVVIRGDDPANFECSAIIPDTHVNV